MIEPGYLVMLAVLVVFIQVMITLFARFDTLFAASMTYISLWIVYFQLFVGYKKLSPDITDDTMLYLLSTLAFFTVLGLAVYVRVLRDKKQKP